MRLVGPQGKVWRRLDTQIRASRPMPGRPICARSQGPWLRLERPGDRGWWAPFWANLRLRVVCLQTLPRPLGFWREGRHSHISVCVPGDSESRGKGDAYVDGVVWRCIGI